MMIKTKNVLGIDIGGSGIKGAPVNIKTGELVNERYRIPTPFPATPEKVADIIQEIAEHFNWKGSIGCGFPAVIQNGIARTAANIDHSWIGTNVNKLISSKTGCPAYVVNDADAAGLAEMEFGAGKSNSGVVILITVGTGLGTVIFSGGQLVPNTELGHIILNGQDAEKYTSDSARKNYDLSWDIWAKRFDKYLNYLEQLLWPDLIIIGGGASKKKDKFFQHLTVQARILPAELLNNAGIVGAALFANLNKDKKPF